MLIATRNITATRNGKGIRILEGEEVPPDVDGLDTWRPGLVEDTEAEAEEADASEATIDPTKLTVKEVMAHLVAHPEQAAEILAAEQDGAARPGIVGPAAAMADGASDDDEDGDEAGDDD